MLHKNGLQLTVELRFYLNKSGNSIESLIDICFTKVLKFKWPIVEYKLVNLI